MVYPEYTSGPFFGPMKPHFLQPGSLDHAFQAIKSIGLVPMKAAMATREPHKDAMTFMGGRM